MKWQMSLICAVFLPLAGHAVIVESAPWGPFPLDTRSQGHCLTTIGAGEVAAGCGLWDVTGTYATTVGGSSLSLDVVHDIKGRLSGTATLMLDTGKGLVPVTMPIRGSSQGAVGALALTLTMQGADAARALRAALSFKLALDPVAARLGGTVTGSYVVAGLRTLVLAQPVTLALPAPMDGTWTLVLDLVWGERGVGGSARLSLSNGVEYAHAVSGKYAGPGALLTFSGTPACPAAMGAAMRATLAPLDGAAGRLTAFSGTLYGQTVAW